MAEFAEREVYLLFGRNGWIGGKLIELLTAQGKTFHLAESRTYNRESVVAEIEKYQPTHILNAAGVTGRPNVDWCEDHRQGIFSLSLPLSSHHFSLSLSLSL